MVRQLKKNVKIEKMPSVKVRPTLRVELKHRVMNCKLPQNLKEPEKLDMDSLNKKVLNALHSRANVVGATTQSEMLMQTHKEISMSKNLEEIKTSLENSQ